MTLQERLDKISEKLEATKKLLFGDTPPAPPAAEGKTFPLADGTTITFIPDLAEGAQAVIAGQPAPDGDYPMPDGSTVSVAAGVIAKIAPAGDGDPAKEGVDMQGEMNSWLKDQIAQLISKFNAQSEELAALKKENEAVKAEFKKQAEQQLEAQKELLEVVAEIAKEPVAPPAEKSKNPFKKQDKEDRLATLAASLQKLRDEKNK
jgi:hypothetical protein